MQMQNGYAPGSPSGGIAVSGGAVSDEAKSYWTLAQCKQAFDDYTGSKSEEMKEAKISRRYRHAAQWTNDQIQVFNKRKQPVVTYNRVGRKIDGIVGFVERLRQDPKAYPRTPQDQPYADLATSVLRFVCDKQDWKSKTPIAAETCATDGIGGIELELIPTREGDHDIGMNLVIDGFFYDPASVMLDFEDAGYHGVSRWLEVGRAKAKYPDYAAEIDASRFQNDDDLSLNTDRDNRWHSWSGKRKFIRLVELWYQHDGDWCWALFTGAKKLAEGKSYFFNEDGETISRYLMFSAAVDHDGDRYAFVRNLKSSQDEINQRRSKGLHILNTRRIIGEVGAFTDLEDARREAARPDGVVLRNRGYEAVFDDAAKQTELAGQLQFLVDAKAEIDNYGPSQVVTGQGSEDQSGRAIALRMQAATAELGPFVLSYRSWKIRVYRALYSNLRKYWTAERYIRVTDDQNALQLVQINGTQTDPVTGLPQRVNPIAQLDVDIILDEGPDTINAMADTNETLREVLPTIGPMLTPQLAQAAVQILIETSALPDQAKKMFRQAVAPQQPPPPDPMLEMAKRIELAKGQGEAHEKEASAGLKEAQTRKTLMEAQLTPVKAAHEAALAQSETHEAAAHKAHERAHDIALFHADQMTRGADRGDLFTRDLHDRAERFAFKRADLERDRENTYAQAQQAQADRDARAATQQAAPV